jgi:hypothetical protein
LVWFGGVIFRYLNGWQAWCGTGALKSSRNADAVLPVASVTVLIVCVPPR